MSSEDNAYDLLDRAITETGIDACALHTLLRGMLNSQEDVKKFLANFFRQTAGSPAECNPVMESSEVEGEIKESPSSPTPSSSPTVSPQMRSKRQRSEEEISPSEEEQGLTDTSTEVPPAPVFPMLELSNPTEDYVYDLLDQAINQTGINPCALHALLSGMLKSQDEVRKSLLNFPRQTAGSPAECHPVDSFEMKVEIKKVSSSQTATSSSAGGHQKKPHTKKGKDIVCPGKKEQGQTKTLQQTKTATAVPVLEKASKTRPQVDHKSKRVTSGDRQIPSAAASVPPGSDSTEAQEPLQVSCLIEPLQRLGEDIKQLRTNPALTNEKKLDRDLQDLLDDLQVTVEDIRLSTSSRPLSLLDRTQKRVRISRENVKSKVEGLLKRYEQLREAVKLAVQQQTEGQKGSPGKDVHDLLHAGTHYPKPPPGKPHVCRPFPLRRSLGPYQAYDKEAVRLRICKPQQSPDTPLLQRRKDAQSTESAPTHAVSVNTESKRRPPVLGPCGERNATTAASQPCPYTPFQDCVQLTQATIIGRDGRVYKGTVTQEVTGSSQPAASARVVASEFRNDPQVSTKGQSRVGHLPPI